MRRVLALSPVLVLALSLMAPRVSLGQSRLEGTVTGATLTKCEFKPAFACLACLTPIVVLVFGAIGLGAWTGRLDIVLLPLLVGFVMLKVYHYHTVRRRTQ